MSVFGGLLTFHPPSKKTSIWCSAVSCSSGNQVSPGNSPGNRIQNMDMVNGSARERLVFCSWYMGTPGARVRQRLKLNDICVDGETIDIEQGPLDCDNGNMMDGDGCSSFCTVECGFECGGSSFSTNESSHDVCWTVCGDGLRAGNEQCDNGKVGENDGCSLSCAVEASLGWECHFPLCGSGVCWCGWHCDGESDAQSSCTTVCGKQFKRTMSKGR